MDKGSVIFNITGKTFKASGMSSKQNTIDMNYKKELSKRFATPSRKTSSASVALALIGGIAIGTVVSLLFAPQSGEDTRDMIADRSRDLKDGFKDQIKSL